MVNRNDLSLNKEIGDEMIKNYNRNYDLNVNPSLAANVKLCYSNVFDEVLNETI